MRRTRIRYPFAPGDDRRVDPRQQICSTAGEPSRRPDRDPRAPGREPRRRRGDCIVLLHRRPARRRDETSISAPGTSPTSRPTCSRCSAREPAHRHHRLRHRHRLACSFRTAVPARFRICMAGLMVVTGCSSSIVLSRRPLTDASLAYCGHDGACDSYNPHIECVVVGYISRQPGHAVMLIMGRRCAASSCARARLRANSRSSMRRGLRASRSAQRGSVARARGVGKERETGRGGEKREARIGPASPAGFSSARSSDKYAVRAAGRFFGNFRFYSSPTHWCADARRASSQLVMTT